MTVPSSPPSQYACKCLNVRVTSASRPRDSNAPFEHDEEFSALYVGSEGIKSHHPQLTLRYKGKPMPEPNSARNYRYTTLSCLICQLTIYRVRQPVVPDVDGKEGPVLPSEDWVDEQVLSSPSGWIQISKNCLHGDLVAKTRSSQDFSSLFSVVLPPANAFPITPVSENSPKLSSKLSERSIFADKPLFPPPPFTPSHPVFKYLSEVAESQSHELRLSADAIVRGKLKEIDEAESIMRRQVELLWKTFRVRVGDAQLDRQSANNHRRSSSHNVVINHASANGSPDSSSRNQPVYIRDFTPVRVSSSRVTNSTPRQSSLSASLASSSFHHPRETTGQPGAVTRADTRRPSLSSESNSSVTLANEYSPAQANGTSVLHFRRDNEDQVNTAASYRYFLNLEQEMERQRKARQQTTSQLPDGKDHRPSPSRKGKHKQSLSEASARPASPPRPENSRSGSGQTQGSDNSTGKGKRKVTFDVEPDVVTIKQPEQDGGVENHQKFRQDDSEAQEMMFHLEDENGGRQRSQKPFSLMTEESRQSSGESSHPRNRSKPQRRNDVGLPGSYRALRPESLPKPSHMMSKPTSLPSAQDVRSQQPSSSGITSQPTEHNHSPSRGPVDADISNLLAANTPSHRGLWDANGRAWNAFVGRSRNGSDGLFEDDDSDSPPSSPRHFVGSLPIPVRPFTMQKEDLSLASYNPKSAIGEQSGVEAQAADEKSSPSSKTSRKGMYSQRDQYKMIDPGTLDFAIAEDGDEYETQESEQEGADREDVNTGKKVALKILAKRAELPSEGMWRSLAD